MYYIALNSGVPPSVIRQTWPAKDINDMLEAHLQNQFDFNGWQKAGAVIGWGLNPDIADATKRFASSDWRAFTPQPPQEEKPADPEQMRRVLEARYG